MSMDCERHSGPHSRLPSKLVHIVNRVHCGLRCLSQQRQRRQQLWQTLHTQPEPLTVQGSKLRRRRRDGKVTIEISFAYSVKLISNTHHVLVCLSWACVARAPHCVNTRDSQVPPIQIVDAIKDMFSKLRATARQQEVNNINQTQSMNDAVFFSESPQARFHEEFLASHVS